MRGRHLVFLPSSSAKPLNADFMLFLGLRNGLTNVRVRGCDLTSEDSEFMIVSIHGYSK